MDPGALSIPWDILKLQNVYSDDSKEPDAEHHTVAILMGEGFLANLVTTNWDPLLEKAHAISRSDRPNDLRVIANNDDLDGGSSQAPRLLKIHGCARKAVENPALYKRFLVATSDEIARWDTASAPLAEAARALLREGPSFFIGLSGQDFDLKVLFAKVKAGRDVPFPVTPCRVNFCTSELSPDHHAILKLIYGETAYNSQTHELVLEAALPLYAKPFLGAIYLLGLEAKIKAFLTLGEPEISTPFLTMALRVLDNAEKSLCSVFDPIVPADERWRSIIYRASRFINRLMSLYLTQKISAERDSYEPLSQFNLSKIEGSSPAATGNLHWLLLALSCVMEGERKGFWTVEFPTDRACEGQMILEKDSSRVSLFLLDRAIYRARLEHSVLTLDPSPNVVVVLYPAEKLPPAAVRFPKRLLPGSRRDPEDIIEISLQEVLDGSTNEDLLMDAIHKEFAIAMSSA